MAFFHTILNKGQEDFRLDPTQIHAELTLAFSKTGDAFLNIRTRGSETREKPGSANQKLQLGREAIAQLKQILAEV